MKSLVRALIVTLLVSTLAGPAEASLFGRKHKSKAPRVPKIIKTKEPKIKIPIRGFEIEGNINVAKEVILLSVSSKVGDPFNESKLRKDEDAIRALGYFSSVETEIHPFKGGMMITIRVVENPLISKLRIEGNQIVPTAKLKELLGIKLNETLNIVQLQDGVKKINKYYQDKGYAFCGILSQEQFAVDPRSQTLRIRIAEPKLRRINITGNRKTRTYVITREMGELKRGETLKTEKVKRALRDVYNLGYFEDVKPPTPKLDLKKQIVDLDVEVKEQKTGTASFGGGYSSVNGLIGFVDVAENNFAGRGQQVRAKYQFGGERSYILSFTEPWLGGHPVSLGGSIFKTDVNREEFSNAISIALFNEQRSGWGVISTWRVHRDTRLSVSFNDEDVKLDSNIGPQGALTASLPADLQLLDPNHTGVVEYKEQTVGTNWTKDVRDNFMMPTSGYRLSLGFQVTGGVFQGITGFNKYIADYRTYTKLKLFNGSIFAFRFRGGVTQVTNGELRFIDRFAVGGNDSIRGYFDREFTGADFLISTLELRKNFSKVFGTALFYDVGDAYASDGLGFKAHGGYGAGVRITTPMGPFRLDYGIPTDSGRSGRLHFGIGEMF